jgi:hypothetical protein
MAEAKRPKRDLLVACILNGRTWMKLEVEFPKMSELSE